jgi:hypothetical protein
MSQPAAIPQEILTLLGAIRNPSKRADEEVHAARMAGWKYGPVRLRHGHARSGKELLWSSRHSILLGRLW